MNVLRDSDQLGPASVADGRIGVKHEAKDLVADGVAGDVGADLLDDAGIVAAEDDGELVLDPHLLEQSRGDRVVGRVGRRGMDAHEHLAAQAWALVGRRAVRAAYRRR